MNALEQALVDSAYIVENSAKELCPVDTGRLRASITHKVDLNALEAVVGTNVDYAPYIEYGTGLFNVKGEGRQDRWCYKDVDGNWHSTIGQKPQPFLEPALENNKAEIINILHAAAREYIKEQTKK